MMAKGKQRKNCEHCSDLAISGERYCKECKKAVLAELKVSGYLETGGYGRKGLKRTSDMKELTHETKYGTNHG